MTPTPRDFAYPMTFLPCQNMPKTVQFYHEILGLEIGLEQGPCTIFKVGQPPHFAYWGFCSHYQERLSPAARVCLTLVVEAREDVDDWHQKITDIGVKCLKNPAATPQFKIYNAFYEDPNGYSLEIQAFDPDGRPLGHDDNNR